MHFICQHPCVGDLVLKCQKTINIFGICFEVCLVRFVSYSLWMTKNGTDSEDMLFAFLLP